MIALFALLLAAQPAADPPLDPSCPLGDRASARPAGSECIGRMTRGYAFAFVYSAEVRAIPPLEAMLRREAWREEAFIAGIARDWIRDRESIDAEVFPLSYEAIWSVDAALPEIAAASGSIATYTGGAHGGIAYKAILVDRRRGRRIALAELFSDPARAMLLVEQGFCAALREEMSDRRGTDESNAECPRAVDQPVTLSPGSSQRIGSFYALLNPYVAGSWAEGPYEFGFPVTAELLTLIRPEYRPAFEPAAAD